MHKVLVSACLLGQPVRYDGGDKKSHDAILQRWIDERRVVPICPELAGGLPVPRRPAEIQRGSGKSVLAGIAVVLDNQGSDVTPHFVAGARAAVELSARHGILLAILKEGSPSCGSSSIYDGSFSGVKIPSQGVTAAALTAAGVRVFSEFEFVEAQAFLQQAELAS